MRDDDEELGIVKCREKLNVNKFYYSTLLLFFLVLSFLKPFVFSSLFYVVILGSDDFEFRC